jgi:hypothetical protein
MDGRSPLGDIMNICKKRNKQACRDESDPQNGNKRYTFFLLPLMYPVPST